LISTPARTKRTGGSATEGYDGPQQVVSSIKDQAEVHPIDPAAARPSIESVGALPVGFTQCVEYDLGGAHQNYIARIYSSSLRFSKPAMSLHKHIRALLAGHHLELVAVVVLSTLFIFAAVRALQIELQQQRPPRNLQPLSVILPQHDDLDGHQHAVPGKPFVVRGSRYGYRTGSDWRPARLEINQLVTSGPAFDLYLQCQNIIMARNQDDALSYYEIAGDPICHTSKACC
jgi:hypothetical protein